MPQDAPPPVKTLPRYVGYELIRDYLYPGDTIETVRRRIQREMRMGRFPQPIPSGSRANTFDLDEVLAWHERNKAGLVRSAATRPDDLAPDQLADAAVELLTRALEHEIGQPIDPSGIHVTYAPPARPVTVEAFAAAEAAELAQWQERFEGFDAARAYILAAILFPTLRPTFAAGARDDGVREVFTDDQALYDLALSAMNDDSWENGLAALKARSKPKMNG